MGFSRTNKCGDTRRFHCGEGHFSLACKGLVGQGARPTFTKGKLVNKSQLIDALAARYEGNRKAAAHALESVLDTITREVAKGEKVAITGFGSFEKKVRDARWVRNPSTGAADEGEEEGGTELQARRPAQGRRLGCQEAAQAHPGGGREGHSRPPPSRPSSGRLPRRRRRPVAAAKKTARRRRHRQEGLDGEEGSGEEGAAKKAPARRSRREEGTAAKKSTAKKTHRQEGARHEGAAKKTSTAKKHGEEGRGQEGGQPRRPRRRRAAAKKSPAKKSTAKKALPRSPDHRHARSGGDPRVAAASLVSGPSPVALAASASATAVWRPDAERAAPRRGRPRCRRPAAASARSARTGAAPDSLVPRADPAPKCGSRSTPGAGREQRRTGPGGVGDEPAGSHPGRKGGVEVLGVQARAGRRTSPRRPVVGSSRRTAQGGWCSARLRSPSPSSGSRIASRARRSPARRSRRRPGPRRCTRGRGDRVEREGAHQSARVRRRRGPPSRDLARARVFTGTSRANVWDIAAILSVPGQPRDGGAVLQRRSRRRWSTEPWQ